MNAISQVSAFRFTSPHLPIVCLRVRIAKVAERFGLTVETWEEDGLGPACGMFIKFPSGRVMLLSELEHQIEHFGREGPTVYIGASEVAAFGVEPLVAEVLESLGLQNDAVAWVAPNDSRNDAAQLMARMTHKP